MPFYTKLTAVLLCLSIGLSAIPQAAGENPAQPDLAAEVSKLIADLDANSLSVRRAAEQRLRKIGPAVLTHLPPPDLIPQPGVRQILARLRIQLENQQARLSTKASHVTLSGTYPVEDLLRKITEQTGNQIDGSELPATLLARNIDVDFQNTPFWKVVDQLAGQLMLRHRFTKTAEALQFYPATEGEADIAVTYSGPFRVVVTSIRRRPEVRDVRVLLAIAAEPRLRPLFLSQALRYWNAKTSDGRNLPVKNPAAFLELPLVADGGRSAQLLLDFEGAQKPVDRLALNGKVTLTVAAGEEQIRFTDLLRAEGVARRRGGVTVILNKAVTNEASAGKHAARIEAAVMYDARGPAFESHRTWIYHNRVYLETADGDRIDFAGGQRTSLSRTGAVMIEYPFPDLERPLSDYRFVYVAPTLIVNVPVTIHFDDLQVKN